MTPDELASELPAPRDDEPASLRADIADELADHLHSALGRELLRTPDEAAARQNVLSCFGDPRRIARILWFDAMKEKIMSQRLTAAALVVAILAAFASTAVSWLVVREAQRANEAMVAQTNAATEAMMKKLGEITAGAAAPPVSLEWNPVEFRLYVGSPDRPAMGFQVFLTGHLLDTAQKTIVTGKTDERGIADMGLVRPGRHAMHVLAPWGETREHTEVTVRPGLRLTQNIECPGSPPEKSTVEFAVNWPDDLAERGYWLVCDFAMVPRQIGGVGWSLPQEVAEYAVALSPGGELVPLAGTVPAEPSWAARQALFDIPSDFDGTNRNAGIAYASARRTHARELSAAFVFPKTPIQGQVQWPAADYRLDDVLILERKGLSDQGDLQQRLILAGILNTAERSRNENILMAAFPTMSWVSPGSWPGAENQWEAILKEQPRFHARADGVNHWQIELPPRLVDIVRKIRPAEESERAEAKSAE